jgi:hypothetical protein
MHVTSFTDEVNIRVSTDLNMYLYINDNTATYKNNSCTVNASTNPSLLIYRYEHPILTSGTLPHSPSDDLFSEFGLTT